MKMVFSQPIEDIQFTFYRTVRSETPVYFLMFGDRATRDVIRVSKSDNGKWLVENNPSFKDSVKHKALAWIEQNEKS